MKKFVCPILLFACLVILSVTDAFACKCVSPTEGESIDKQVREAYKNSAAVFVGEVIEIVEEPDTYFVKAKFKVEKAWGIKSRDEITITTGKGGGDCGYEFEVGRKYVVYASQDKDVLRTNICTRTASFESNKDVAVLNKIKKLKVKSSPK